MHPARASERGRTDSRMESHADEAGTSVQPRPYRGRLAPSPTGHLHLGHARTFWTAVQRAQAAGPGSTMVMRVDDLDGDRCRQEYADAALEDLTWLGLTWSEGPDVGGPLGPYVQSQRMHIYRQAFERLQALGLVYWCCCSRRDIVAALSAPHAGEEEPVYPGTCRPCARNRTTSGNGNGDGGGNCTSTADAAGAAGAVAATAAGIAAAAGGDGTAEIVHAAAPAAVPAALQPTSSAAEAPATKGTGAAGGAAAGSTDAGALGGAAGRGAGTQAAPPEAASTSSAAVEGGAAVAGAAGSAAVVPAGNNSAAARQALKAARRAAREAGQHQQLQQCKSGRRKPPGQDQEGPQGGGGGNRAGPTSVGPASGAPPAPQQARGSWRFQVRDGEVVRFTDQCMGPQELVAGKDFGDFVVWRHDGMPSYQLSCAVDDAAMGITEVVRGCDLITSTARQLLIGRALGLTMPTYYHCPLMVDATTGVRLAKRHDALSLRTMREQGAVPAQLLARFSLPSSHVIAPLGAAIEVHGGGAGVESEAHQQGNKPLAEGGGS